MFEYLRARRAGAAAVVFLAGSLSGCGFVRSVRIPTFGLWPERRAASVSRYEGAKRLCERGRYPEAIAALDSWLEDYAKTPLEPAVLYHLARSQFLAGQADKATATYGLLVKDYAGTQWAKFAQDDLANVTAKIPNLADYKGTSRWWWPGDWFTPSLPIVRDFEAARRRFRRGRYNEAIMGFRTLAERNPASPLAPAAWYWVARSHEQLEQAAKAREFYSLVTKTFPGTEWEKHAQEGLRRLKGI